MPRVPGSLPPYALAVPSFRFPALAALAARAPLGGAREVTLATLLAARLAASCADGEVELELRSERALLARQWLAGLTLPGSARVALGRAIEATGGPASPGVLRGALEAMAGAVGPLLDPPARSELQQLAAALGE